MPITSARIDRLSAAIHDPEAIDVVAGGLATGELYVVNRHSVSTSALVFVTASELASITGEEALSDGCWTFATGFVAVTVRDP